MVIESFIAPAHCTLYVYDLTASLYYEYTCELRCFDILYCRNAQAGAESWKTLPEYFMAHGYNSLGFGKTFHGCSTEIVPCPLPAPPNAGPCVYPAHNVSLSGMGYCDLERSWSTEVLPYLPFKLEHCPYV